MVAIDWTPPPHVAALLYTDATGALGDRDVIEEARETGCWPELVGPVTELMRDEQLFWLWRWIALQALLEWADPAGYDAVVQACSAPSESIWLHAATDRFSEGDTSFAHMAQAMGDSKELAEERGTAGLRLDALRALLSIADQVSLVHSFRDGIFGAMRGDDVAALHAELHAAAVRTAALEVAPFPSHVQAAGLVSLLVEVDEAEAVRLARQLLQTDYYRIVVMWLRGVVGRGRGEESLRFADDLVKAGRALGFDPYIESVLEARRYRTSGSAT